MDSCWDCIQTEFSGDETTNFGPRIETGTALYQVDTLATISPRNQAANEVATLTTAAVGEFACIGVNQHLSVFRDSQLQITIAFESTVEAAVWSPDASLLGVVDSAGRLYIFIADTVKSVFSHKLLPHENTTRGRAFQSISFHGCDNGLSDLILLSSSGMLFIVKDLDTASLAQECDNIINIVEQQLQFATVQTHQVHTTQTCDVVPLGQGNAVTVGCGDSVLAVWEWHEKALQLVDTVESFLDKGVGIVGAKASSDQRLLLALDENGVITVWCMPEFVLLAVVPTSEAQCIADFLLLETRSSASNSLEGMRLVLHVKNPKEDLENEASLKILSLPDGECIYSLQMGHPLSLPRCGLKEESLLVAEGTPESRNAGKISTIRFRCLTETNPETRLHRMLQKRKFEEALQFAELFHLDKEVVYMAHINHLLDKLSPWNITCLHGTVLAMTSQLWHCLDNVKDCLLVAENCIRAALPSFQDMWKLLRLCQNKLEAAKTDKEEKQQLLQTKLLDIQNRLLTFKLAFGADSYSAEKWVRFQQASLLHVTCRHMTDHNAHVAILIWRRHSAEWAGQLTSHILDQVLVAVPATLGGNSLLCWLLDDLIPYVARFLPRSLGQVGQWTIERATNMEILEKSGWPGNALRFLMAVHKKMIEVMEVDFSESKTTAAENATKTKIDACLVLGPLSNMLQLLKDLVGLQDYNLRISLRQFQQETKETLAFRMLDRVVMVELIVPTLERYITPYIQANLLNQDYILATYIKDLLSRTGHMKSYTGHSAWEEKVLAIISFVVDPKEKCCAILNVMKHAPLPWSAEIERLVEEGLKINHPNVSDLREQKKIVTVRQLMQDYQLNAASHPCQSLAQKLARLIVQKDRDTSLQDGLQILKEYNISSVSAEADIYFHHAHILISTERVSEYMTLLKRLSQDMARRCGMQVVYLAEVFLDQISPPAPLKEREKKQQLLLTEAAVLTLKHLITQTKDPVELSELHWQLLTFSRLSSLQREYNVYMSVAENSSDVHRGQVFVKAIHSYLKQGKPVQDGFDFMNIYRLGDLLGIRREDFLVEMVIREICDRNMEAAECLCRELLLADPSPHLGRALYQIGMTLLQYQRKVDEEAEEDKEAINRYRSLPFLTKQLATRAIVVCDEELLPSCLELSRAAQFWQRTSAQCEAAETPAMFKQTESKLKPRTPLQAYKADIMYEDDALVMSSTIVLPLVSTSLAATLSFSQGDEGDGEEEQQAGCVSEPLQLLQTAVGHLRENSHLELALRLINITFSSLHQSLQQHDMGYPTVPEMQTWLERERAVMQEAESRAGQLIRDLVSGILVKIFGAKSVDGKLALGYLLSVPRKVSISCLNKSISSCGLNFRKLKAIASIGVCLGHVLKETTVIGTCQELEVGASWGVRLAKLKIDFKEAFKGSISAKRKIIADLANCEQANITVVADFCNDFKLDIEDGYMVYLEHLLMRPFCHDVSPKSRHHILRLRRAQFTVSAILRLQQQNQLLKKLKAMYKKTSPYDYENIDFLLTEINKLEPTPLYQKGLQLVNYLKVYSRHNPPSDYELSNFAVEQKEDAVGLSSPAESLTQWSSERLPVHLLLEGDAWKIITSELQAETVIIWLQIAQLLNLSTDEVYLMAVQNMVKQHVAHVRGSCAATGGLSVSGFVQHKKTALAPKDWKCSEASLRFLEQIQQLLSSVSNCEMALACANWVVKELPMGGEKVVGLQGCVAFARRWHQACGDNTQQKEKSLAACVKFEKVLSKILTQQALYMHGLAQPCLLQLVSSPEQLLIQLLEHPSVIGKSGQTGTGLDIYAAVEQLAEVNSLDVGAAIVEALQKWLLSSDSQQDADTTMNISFSSLKFTDESVSGSMKDNIKRVQYFLQRGPKQQMIEFLVGCTLMEEADNITYLGRLQCLYCLLQVAKDEDLRPLGYTCDKIRELLKVMAYLSQLEQLHIHHSQSTFHDCNKTGLVKGIWRNHSHQKSAVLLVASLCLDFGIDDHQQWAAILQQMLTLGLLDNMEYVLNRLQAVPPVWSLPVYTRAWQAMLTSTLSKVTVPLTDEQIKICLHCFNLMQSCPVLGHLDLRSLAQHFHRLELLICWAACLDMDPMQQGSKLKEILNGNRSKFLLDVYHLIQLGLNLSTAVHVQETLFEVILQEEDYQSVTAQALSDFIEYTIKQDNIDGCLLFAASNNMLSQAESVLELYFQYYPEQREFLINWCHDNKGSPDTELQGYLQMKGLL